MKKWLVLGLGSAAVLAAVFLLGMNVGQGKDVLPGPDVRVVGQPSFSRDIQPIFNEFCVGCHAQAGPSILLPEETKAALLKSGLHLDSYEGVMKGTSFGPVVVPRDPETSNLLAVVKRLTSPHIFMPFDRDPLTPNRIKNIQTWIRNGAPNN